MTSLLDIAPLSTTVMLRGVERPVTGIGVEGIIYLLQRFPILGALLSQRDASALMSPAALLAMAPDAVDAIIATGLGHRNSPETEAALHNLVLDEQIECLTKIMEVTMPRGVVPFVEMLNKMGSKGGVPGWAQVMKSPEQSNSA
jgi:hypothetical protein